MSWYDVEKSEPLALSSPTVRENNSRPRLDLIIVQLRSEFDKNSGFRFSPATLHDNVFPHARLSEGTFHTVAAEPFHRSISPPMKYRGLFQWLRCCVLSTYRLLFSIVILANLLALGALLVEYHDHPIQRYNFVLTATTINTATTILSRQELAINALFCIFLKVPAWMPRKIRTICARIYNYGGVHSGCGIAAVLWFTLFTFYIIYYSHTARTFIQAYSAILTLTVLLDVILLGIIVMAHPSIRRSHHNAFEVTHRYAGWTVLLLFTVHVVLMSNFADHEKDEDHHLIHLLLLNPSFWLVMFSIIMVIIPWTRLKRMDVSAEILSSHATRLHFSNTDPSWCSSIRLADKPLQEWHSFVAIPERDRRGCSMIVSNAGDWTRRIIQSPPQKLWVRGFPARNLLAMARIFSPVLLVCTGSGVGPILSLLTAQPKHSCRILWSAASPRQTFGQGVVDTIFQADPQACIVDTRVTRRPDLVKMAYELFVGSRAEAVFAVSNPAVVRKLRYGLKSKGVPFFAPIFDS